MLETRTIDFTPPARTSSSLELVDAWTPSRAERIVVHAFTGPLYCHPLVGEILAATSPVSPDPAGGARAFRQYLHDIDGRDHVLLLASIAAESPSRPIALARYVRVDASRVAAPALVVAPAMRRRGIATRLLGNLVEIARAQGIERFRVETRTTAPGVLQLVRHVAMRPAIVWSGPAPVIEFPLEGMG
jgi:GNAT superfamily N-acetyltransferase